VSRITRKERGETGKIGRHRPQNQKKTHSTRRQRRLLWEWERRIDLATVGGEKKRKEEGASRKLAEAKRRDLGQTESRPGSEETERGNLSQTPKEPTQRNCGPKGRILERGIKKDIPALSGGRNASPGKGLLLAGKAAGRKEEQILFEETLTEETSSGKYPSIPEGEGRTNADGLLPGDEAGG